MVKVIMRPLYLGGIVKWMSLLVASTGMLLGYWVYRSIFTEPSHWLEYSVILVSAVLNISHIVFDMLLFKTIDFKDVMNSGMRYLPSAFTAMNDISDESQKQKVHLALSKSSFTDLYIPQFMTLLVAMGFLFYSLAGSGLLQSGRYPVPGLDVCLSHVFSFIGLSSSEKWTYDGRLWLIVDLCCKFLVFIWLVMFVTSAPSIFVDTFTAKKNAGMPPVPHGQPNGPDSSGSPTDKEDVRHDGSVDATATA